jgi:hypothetical protein
VLSGPGTITGNVTNSGQINPGGGGTAAGTLTINGAFSQTGSGSLTFQIGGTDPTLVDQLIVSGAAVLDGTLNVALINGYMPQGSDQVQIMAFAWELRDANKSYFIPRRTRLLARFAGNRSSRSRRLLLCADRGHENGLRFLR